MRSLHTMLRVGSAQRSIDFYTNVLLGMKLLRTSETRNTNTRWRSWVTARKTDEAVDRADLQLGRRQL